MEGKTERRGSGTRNPTPIQVLAHINNMYTHWMLFQNGVLTIVSAVSSLISNSQYFIPSRTRSKDSNETKFVDLLDSIQFEFRGASRLYNSIGCVTPVVTSPVEYEAAMRIVRQEIVVPLASYILQSMRASLYPKITNASMLSKFDAQVMNHICSRIIPIFDTTSRRFVLVVRK